MNPKKRARNNITRLLEQRAVPHQVYEIPVKKKSAIETAKILGVEPAVMFKTIVVLIPNTKKPILLMAPANCEVDLKAVARAVVPMCGTTHMLWPICFQISKDR